MKGWMLYPRETLLSGSCAFDWFIEEAAKLNIELKILFFEDFKLISSYENRLLHCGREITLPDFVVMRGYNTLLSHHIECTETRVINNSYSMALSRNKMLTHQKLCSKGITTPTTLYNISHNYTFNELTEFFDSEVFIIKECEGSKGEQVYMIKSKTDFTNCLTTTKGDLLAQQYIKTSYGRDIRVWVIGDTIAASVLRYSETSFKSNFSLGGKVKPIKLDIQAETIAIESVKALGLEFAGVDLLYTDRGYSVCEVNGNAGFRSITSISNKNIPGKLFEYIKSLF